MRIEIRDQNPGDTWPSGQAWEIPDAANLLAICADLTRDEIVHVMRWAGEKPRAAHAVAQEIEAVLRKRGDDVRLVKREVVKVRAVRKGSAARAWLDSQITSDDPDADMNALRFICPALSRDDAKQILDKIAGQSRNPEVALVAIREHFAAMGPVEIMVVDDPGKPS